MDDAQLLHEFVQNRSEDAFRTLVEQHLDFVYSIAFRQVGDRHRAEEIAQSVFTDLASKAPRLSPQIVLTGWLFRATRFAAGKVIRSEMRRQQRERELVQMEHHLHHDSTEPAWEQLEPLLHEALEQLSELDRNAVFLRFFEKKPLKEVGSRLGLNEAAARKRIGRAVDKLRTSFMRRGVTVSSAALGAMLLAQTSQAAPAGLAASITGAAVLQSATFGASTLTLSHGLLNIMAISKLHIVAAATAAVLLVGGTAYVVQPQQKPAPAAPITASAMTDDESLLWDIIRRMNSRALQEAPPRVFLRTSGESDGREGAIAMNGKFMGKGMPAAELLATAYSCSRSRVRLSNGAMLPEGRFDYLVSLASGQKEALQGLLRERLGLTARIERREEEVYVMSARPGEYDNLRPCEGLQGGSRVSNRDGEITFRNTTVDGFVRGLEQMLPHAILNESGLQGRYDMRLVFDPPADGGEPHPPTAEEMKKALSDQLGLELRLAKRTLEVLLVEPAKAN